MNKDVERFFAKTKENKETGCLEWIGAKKPAGYGNFYYKGKHVNAHKAAWLFAGNTIADGLYVCHKCDNPSCVNINHLFVGSPKENQEDMIKKGRLRKSYKIHEKEIPVVFALKNLGVSGVKIASIFGVSDSLISMILNNKVRHGNVGDPSFSTYRERSFQG